MGTISKHKRPFAAGHHTVRRSQEMSALQPVSHHVLNTASCTHSTTNPARATERLLLLGTFLPLAATIFHSGTLFPTSPCPFQELPTLQSPKSGSVQPSLVKTPFLLAAWCKPALHYPRQLPGTCKTHEVLGAQALGLDKNVYRQLGANSADPPAFTHALHVDIHRVKQNPF